MLFGVAGAIAGGVIGDALTDGVAGFAGGSIADPPSPLEPTRNESTADIRKANTLE